MAYHLARRLLPDHSCKFSRHDFTLAQLFVCLVVREFFALSFRRTEALLADSPAWLAEIGLAHAPDHNTLWRAFDALLTSRRCSGMLDLLAPLFARCKLLQLRRKPLAIDSTCYEQHHRSLHYDRRCRRIERERGEAQNHPGKRGQTVNAARGRRLRRIPKLAIAVDSGCHLILANANRSSCKSCVRGAGYGGRGDESVWLLGTIRRLIPSMGVRASGRVRLRRLIGVVVGVVAVAVGRLF